MCLIENHIFFAFFQHILYLTLWTLALRIKTWIIYKLLFIMILNPDLKIIFQTIMEYQMSYSLVPACCFSAAMCCLPRHLSLSSLSHLEWLLMEPLSKEKELGIWSSPYFPGSSYILYTLARNYTKKKQL